MIAAPPQEAPLLKQGRGMNRKRFMQEMSVSQFKARLSQTMQQVHAAGEPVRLLRYGKPFVEVYPAATESPKSGKLGHTLVHMDDIVSPLGDDDWEAARQGRQSLRILLTASTMAAFRRTQ
jgi:antitoxin (DNA-binding transcriptional repressor) of toxin-antitoxin stability system